MTFPVKKQLKKASSSMLYCGRDEFIIIFVSRFSESALKHHHATLNLLYSAKNLILSLMQWLFK